MPYIKQSDRDRFQIPIPSPSTPGELTYVLTRIIHEYLNGRVGGDSFRLFSEVLGSLEATKLEFYRRKVAKYEDVKIEQNGDV